MKTDREFERLLEGLKKQYSNEALYRSAVKEHRKLHKSLSGYPDEQTRHKKQLESFIENGEFEPIKIPEIPAPNKGDTWSKFDNPIQVAGAGDYLFGKKDRYDDQNPYALHVDSKLLDDFQTSFRALDAIARRDDNDLDKELVEKILDALMRGAYGIKNHNNPSGEPIIVQIIKPPPLNGSYCKPPSKDENKADIQWDNESLGVDIQNGTIVPKEAAALHEVLHALEGMYDPLMQKIRRATPHPVLRDHEEESVMRVEALFLKAQGLSERVSRDGYMVSACPEKKRDRFGLPVTTAMSTEIGLRMETQGKLIPHKDYDTTGRITALDNTYVKITTVDGDQKQFYRPELERFMAANARCTPKEASNMLKDAFSHKDPITIARNANKLPAYTNYQQELRRARDIGEKVQHWRSKFGSITEAKEFTRAGDKIGTAQNENEKTMLASAVAEHCKKKEYVVVAAPRNDLPAVYVGESPSTGEGYFQLEAAGSVAKLIKVTLSPDDRKNLTPGDKCDLTNLVLSSSQKNDVTAANKIKTNKTQTRPQTNSSGETSEQTRPGSRGKSL